MKNNNQKNRLHIWLPLLFALVMIAGMFLGYKIRENTQTVRSFFKMPGKRTPVQEVMDLINYRYVDKVNLDTLGNDAIIEMLGKLDPHSVYIPAMDLREVNEELQGNFQGIGIEFQIIKDTVNVVTVLPKGPSEKAGLTIGDRLIKVGDSMVAGNAIDIARIKKLLRGPGKSNITLTILRENQIKTIPIERGLIPLLTVEAAYMLNPETGYIKLNKFSENTYEEFMQGSEKLLKKGMQSMILDLRGNGGGILNEAVDIADEFLDGDKMIVYTEGAHARKQTYLCKRPGLFEKGKLIVLVDESSASASEVLCGALQDWDRATIMGRRTFGKGLVQEQYDLSDGSALRLTIARYYTPTGRSIQKSYDHNGNNEYSKELLQRFENGALSNADSNKVKIGKAFKTKGGRTVYGGGGIMPDVFIAFDTSLYSKKINALLRENTLNNFSYQYYYSQKTVLSKFKNATEFNTAFSIDPKTWNKFVLAAKNDSIPLQNISVVEKTQLEKRLKAALARFIWRTEGYYEIMNADDAAIKKALEQIH